MLRFGLAGVTAGRASMLPLHPAVAGAELSFWSKGDHAAHFCNGGKLPLTRDVTAAFELCRRNGHDPGGDMHAYIIEDQYLIARSLQDMLEDLGFTKFSFARSEDAAIVGAHEEKIDLITADVRLLPGDGVKAVEAIGAERNIPVLFITAYREELEERKPDAVVLQKPIKAEELEAAVRRVMGKAMPTAGS